MARSFWSGHGGALPSSDAPWRHQKACACRPGSVPPFASSRLLLGRSHRGWAWIAAEDEYERAATERARGEHEGPAVRNADGTFKDIQDYARSSRADQARRSKPERAKAKAVSVGGSPGQPLRIFSTSAFAASRPAAI